MNHPLSTAQHLIKNQKDPLGYVVHKIDWIHCYSKARGRNELVRHWKKVKNHVIELIRVTPNPVERRNEK